MPVSTDGRLAALSDTDLHRLKWLLGGVLALIAFWALSTVDFSSGGLIFVTWLMLMAILLRPALPGLIPEVIWKAATPLLIAVIAMDLFLHWRGDSVIQPIMRTALLLTFYRALQYRKNREDLQLVLLCLFCLIITGVLEAELTFALQMGIFTPLAMTQLFLLTLLERDKERFLTIEDWQAFRWRPFVRRIRAALNYRFLLVAAGMFTVMVTVSSLIFLMFPRLDLDRSLSLLNMGQTGKIGFNDTMRFGDVSSLSDDDRIALSIEPPERGAIPPRAYWRMAVLDRYFGDEFMASPSDVQLPGVRGGSGNTFYPVYRRPEDDGGDWVFYMENGVSQYLPLLGPVREIKFNSSVRYLANERRMFVKLGSFSMDKFGYRVKDMKEARTLKATVEELEMMRHYRRGTLDVFELETRQSPSGYPLTTLELPTSAQSRDYLASVVDEISNERALNENEFIEETVRYLRRRHRYSTELDEGLQDEDEPLIKWMQGGGAGWCEHFSGALALLTRSAGIPSRVVVGFVGGEWNDYGGYLLVRNRNAHAWVEVLLGDAWMRVDPTPLAGTLAPGAAADGNALSASVASFTGWRAWMDGLRMAWYRRVVDFDSVDQQNLAEDVREQTKSMMESMRGEVEAIAAAVKAWLTDGWDVKRMLRTAGFIALTVVVLLVLRPLYRRVQARLLRRSEWLRERVRTPLIRRKAGRWLQRMQGLTGEAVVEWRETQAALLSLRYGSLTGGEDPEPVFRAARRCVREAR